MVKSLELPSYLRNHNIQFMIFVSTYSGRHYVAVDDSSITESDLPFHPKVLNILRNQVQVKVPLENVLGEMSNSYHVFLAVNADCTFPPSYLVAADSEEEAYRIFITDSDACTIHEEDLKDWNQEDLEFNDNGEPVDSSTVMLEKLKLVAIIYN